MILSHCTLCNDYKFITVVFRNDLFLVRILTLLRPLAPLPLLPGRLEHLLDGVDGLPPIRLLHLFVDAAEVLPDVVGGGGDGGGGEGIVSVSAKVDWVAAVLSDSMNSGAINLSSMQIMRYYHIDSYVRQAPD